MTTGNENMASVHELDKETIRTLASFSIEKQALVKGLILGLRNQDQFVTQQIQAS